MPAVRDFVGFAEVVLIIQYDLHSLFDPSHCDHWGFFVDRVMSAVVFEYCDWMEYPKGDSVLKGHQKQVRAMAISTDGRHLFTASSDCTLIKWDLISHLINQQWSTESRTVSVLAYHSGCLACGHTSGLIQMIDASDGQSIRTLIGHTRKVLTLDFGSSQSISLVLSGSKDSTVRLWNVDSGECVRIIDRLSGYVRSVKFIGNDTVITGSWDRCMKMWDINTGVLKTSVSEGIQYKVWRICMNINCSLLACLFHFGFVVYSWPNLEIVHSSDIHSNRGCFHICNPHLIAVNDREEGMIRLIDTTNGECLRTWDGHSGCAWGIGFTPDGTRMITISRENSIRVWDLSEFCT